jgi:ABC-type multidrug transport system ATPase subunit
MEVEIPLVDLVPREEPVPEPRRISVLDQMKIRLGIEHKLRIRDCGFFLNCVLAVMLVWSYTSVNNADISPIPELTDPGRGSIEHFADDFSSTADELVLVRAFPFAEWSERVLSSLLSDFSWFDSPQSLLANFRNSSLPEIAFLFGGTPFETNLSITEVANNGSFLKPFDGTLAIVESLLKERDVVSTLRSCEFARPEQSRFSPWLASATFYFPYSMLVMMIKHAQYDEKQRGDRVHFLLRIFGIGELSYWLSSLVIHLVEQLPVILVSALAFCDAVKWSKGTAVSLFFASILMAALGLILLHEFFFAWLKGKHSLGFYFSVQITFSSLIGLILTIESVIPRVVIGLFSLLLPQFSFLKMTNVMIEMNIRGNPMTWHTVDGALFAWQFGSLMFWGVWNVIYTLCGARLYGRPPLGWRSLFSLSKWKKLIFGTDQNMLNPVTALEVEMVRKEFAETVAVNDVSLAINSGEIIFAMGPNGSGKSTLIDILTGGTVPTAGRIMVFGEEMGSDFDLLYRHLGIVFQANTLIDNLTCREHLELACSLRGEIGNDILYFSQLLKLEDCLETSAGKLSGGEKRKLCVAMALIRRSAILVLDEPTAGVDAQVRRVIWESVRQMRHATGLISCHSLEEGGEVSTKIMMLSKGRIVFLGTPAELRVEYNCGYYVTFVDDDVDMQRVLEFVKMSVPQAEIKFGRPKAVLVPDTLDVADLLERIDENKEDLGITKYTIHIENLEETMRKVIETDEDRR